MNYAQWKLQFKNLNLRIKRKKIARYKWRSIGEVDKWVYFERASSDLILFFIGSGNKHREFICIDFVSTVQ